ncbi:MAG TPA: hypothetical protein VFZ90_05805 [Gemmatimonadales bacterium]|jgi:hypothetical protein
MRILSVVLSFVVAMSLAGTGLAYLVNRIGEQRIKVQDSWISSGEQKGYQAYGAVATVNADSSVKH